MTSVLTHGFLSDEVEQSVAMFEKKYSGLCQFYRSVGVFAHRAKCEVHGDPRNLRHILVASLFGRALSAYEAVFALASRGMCIDSEAVLRTLLETTLYALAADKSEEVAAKIVGSAEVERLRHIRRLLKQGTLSVEERTSLVSVEACVAADITAKKYKEIKLADVAVWAGDQWMYALPYSNLCMSTHPSARRLGEALKIGPHGEVQNIRWGPSYDSLEENFALSVSCLYQIIRCSSLKLPAELLEELDAIKPPPSS
jgi:hypothetical protein